MADKAISELVAAEQIKAADRFVLEQDSSAKSMTGQVLLNWLTEAADGHGGVQSITKTGSSGLVDTYTITLADQTKQTFTVTNGAKGDKGDNAYLWIKYASQEPTASSHSMSDIPDNWIGVHSGNSSAAPTDWQKYKWFQYKGDKGDKGDPATLSSSKVEYQVSDSGTIIPSGSWSTSVPVVAQGRYLWTRTTTTFNTGSPVVAYSVSRMGIDGTGAVSSVAGISPNPDGNVPLTAENVGALPSTGGSISGEIRMNGQPISGLNPPTEDTQVANKGYVDTAEANAKAYSEQKKLKFANTSVPASSFVSDSTYADYPYRAAVTLSGVTSSMTPEVTFSVAALAETEFAPVAECYNGGVYIYAAEQPPATVIIPTILCWR